ncbi:MAG: bifunctional UDP-N-acetylmuramoyl-tripeptide:D-alanyl-D-alanine ligase/alanine racemase [Bacteroidales bacterium]
MGYSFRDIAKMHHWQEVSAFDRNAPVVNLLTDSRRLQCPENTLFFAIKSEKNDGHRFIDELIERGVKQFVVSNPDVFHKIRPFTNVILAKDSVEALQLIATEHRKRFNIPVIGITGSNGKTIVKEWLREMALSRLTVCASPNSYNSQIGVPLSVWNLDASHQLAIFEAGISLPGEMDRLEKIIQPTIGLFTNIGEAHQENFPSQKEKAKEKLKLFRHTTFLVYCRDHLLIHECVLEERLETFQKIFTWGWHNDADLLIKNITRNGNHSEIILIYQGCEQKLNIPLTDDASIENALHCLALLVVLGWDLERAAHDIGHLHPISMRLEMVEGLNGCTLINDSYSNDLNSLEVGLSYLIRQAGHKNKTLILSDILQSGKSPAELYERVNQMLKNAGVSKLIGIGPDIASQGNAFTLKKYFYADTPSFLSSFPIHSLRDEIILLKGARRFGFERIARALRKRTHETTLEISLPAIAHNLAFYRSHLKPQTKVMAMVKAFAYGSGSHEIAALLQHQHIDYLAVAYPDEGAALRNAGITAPIAVMNPENDSFDLLIEHNLEPEIYSLAILKRLHDFLIRNTSIGQPFLIHLKLDTGMHRLGFMPDELAEALHFIKNNRHLKVASVFSHLAASEDPEDDQFTHRQATLFLEMADEVSHSLGYPVMRHLLNSAGIIRFPEYQFEMVRLGLGLYGLAHCPEIQERLMPVSRLSSVISQIKRIPPGESVGYNRRWKAPRETLVGIVPIGYADGLRRELSFKGFSVKINGYNAPLIGAVSMDMCAIDLTDIPASEGDRVIIFENADEIKHLARLLNTIPYEIITGISPRVKRIYLMD